MWHCTGEVPEKTPHMSSGGPAILTELLSQMLRAGAWAFLPALECIGVESYSLHASFSLAAKLYLAGVATAVALPRLLHMKHTGIDCRSQLAPTVAVDVSMTALYGLQQLVSDLNVAGRCQSLLHSLLMFDRAPAYDSAFPAVGFTQVLWVREIAAYMPRDGFEHGNFPVPQPLTQSRLSLC